MIRPKDRAVVAGMDAGLDAFSRTHGNLPGIAARERREALKEQLLESIHRVSYVQAIVGRPISSGTRLRFTNQGQLGSPVEEFTANGQLSLNCLSHPRGQAQCNVSGEGNPPFLKRRLLYI